MHLETSGSTDNPGARRATVRRSLRWAAGVAAIALFIAGTASATPPAAPRPASVSAQGAQGSGLALQVTLGTDLSDRACGTDTQLDVTQLDQVNFCYRVTNQSSVTLNYQTLADDVVSTILSAAPYTLAPGASYQYNRIIIARESQSPVSTWTAYSEHPGYAYIGNAPTVVDRVFADGFEGAAGTPTYDFVDITTTGTPLDMLGSGFPVNVPIGFPFTYYGQTSDQIVASLEGGFLFGVTGGYLPPQNTSLPNADIGAAILPYWADIEYPQPEDGNTYVETLGAAPNRRFVIEWFNVPILIGNTQDGATFEAILYEGSNQILFQYADTDVGDPARNDGITASIGLNPPAGVEAALQYSYLQPSVSTGKAILFSPTNPVTLAASQQVVLAVGVPVISVSPARFDVMAPAGGSTGATLTIGNIGNRALTWNIGSFSSREHFPSVSRFTLPMGNPALTSGGPAPQLQPAKSGENRAARAPSVDTIPAFAMNILANNASSLVSLDAANPAVVTPIAELDGVLIAGAFVDEDFSKLYTIDYYSNHLRTVDTSSGATSLIGTPELQQNAGISWSSIAWDASTGTLYGMAFAPTRDGFTSFLYTIDPVTAATTLVGPVAGIGDPINGTLVTAIAVDSQGSLYGIELVADDFVAIDKTSGAASVISSLGFDANYSQGLDFDDYTGTLYYAAFNAGTAEAEMYTIDPISGVLTLVSPIGADPSNTQLAAFAIARLGGVCAYPNDVPWLSYDVARGSTAAGATSIVNVTFDASTLAAGTYMGDICVANNDLTNRRVAVPVTLTVN